MKPGGAWHRVRIAIARYEADPRDRAPQSDDLPASEPPGPCRVVARMLELHHERGSGLGGDCPGPKPGHAVGQAASGQIVWQRDRSSVSAVNLSSGRPPAEGGHGKASHALRGTIRPARAFEERAAERCGQIQDRTAVGRHRPELKLRAPQGHDPSGHRRAMEAPPSTPQVWPVIHEARSDRRKAMTSAASSGVPRRPSG